MSITYADNMAEFFYETMSPLVEDRACPFCGTRITAATVGGYFHYEDKPRMLHKNLPCIIDYANYISKGGGTKV